MKKLLLFLLLGMFLISMTSMTSALDWDNVLSYKENNKEVEVINALNLPLISSPIANLKITSHKNLDEPNVDIIANAWNKVIVQEINGLEDYNNFIGTPRFKNMKTGKYEELEYYWEKAIYGDVEINDYGKVCKILNLANGTYESCESKVIGTHKENKIIRWERFENYNIKKGEKITIALNVWVNRGDWYDGIPKFFGKEISGWAEWAAPLADTHPGYTINTLSASPNEDDFGSRVQAKGLINVTKWSVHKSSASTTCFARNTTDLIWSGAKTGSECITDGSVVVADTSDVYLLTGSASDWNAYKATGVTLPEVGTNVDWIDSWRYRGGLTVTVGEMYEVMNVTTRAEVTANLVLNISYPHPNNFYNTTTLNLNYTWVNVSNIDSCWYSLNLGQTNSSRVNCGVNWTGLTATEGSNTWTVYGNLTTGEIGNTTVTFSVDRIAPSLNITYPTDTITYHSLGQNLSLNWTVNDTNLQACWYNWNGTNTTVTCGLNQTYINITDGSNTNVTFYANDTIGNWNSSTTTWSYSIFENSIDYTNSIFETETTTYAVNVTANSSLTAVKLIYNNGSGLTMTNAGSNYWTYSRDTPIGNASFDFYYNFTYASTQYSSGNSTQEVNFTYFTPTDATYTDIFLNISFKDENDLTAINASIPSSSFIYYLGSGVVNKTLSFINNTDNKEYTFSGTTGSKTLYVIPNVQYRRVSDYPQRIWTSTTQTYTTTQTDQVLYLASSTDGIYVTYQVIGIGDELIGGVEVTATRLVGGETISIGAGTTDAAGTVTFWMNPDFQHIVTFSKDGYDDYIFTHFPTQASYSITLGGTTNEEVICSAGITQSIEPFSSFLWANETYNFNYTVSSLYWNLTEIAFTLLDSDGASLGSDSSTSSSGGIVSVNNINVSSYSSITMNYYYDLDETDDECGQVTGTRVWIVQSSTGTEYSIWQLTQDLNTYTTSGLFGFDDFGKTLLSFVIIVLMVGGLSRRYGIASEGAIMGILFGTVFMLDVGLGFIPRVQIGDFVAIEHFVTYLTFIILFIVIIREEKR